MTALTRSDVVNRVIEVELPRYAVTPWDRFENADEYWKMSRTPSSIPGGTWTTFNWRTNAIGVKTQRVEYADQLRQPQSEVAFDELICYLLDLGAVPDAHGWRLLRTTGLWTPVGCCLMYAAGGQGVGARALTVAPLDDSDGHLSLAVRWDPVWTTRNDKSLPPYWVRLPAPVGKMVLDGPSKPTEGGASSSFTSQELDETVMEKGSLRKKSIDTIEKESDANFSRDIACHISAEGITTAIPQNASARPGSSSVDNRENLYVEHVKIRPNSTRGDWFASAITAYGTSGSTVLWNYKIPDDILTFARRDTIPCGILVLLEMVDMDKTPEWSSQRGEEGQHQVEMFARKARDRAQAVQAEARLPPAQKAQAQADRMRRETQQQIDESELHPILKRRKELLMP